MKKTIKKIKGSFLKIRDQFFFKPIWIKEYEKLILQFLDLILLFPILIAPFVTLFTFSIILILTLIAVITVKQNYSLITKKVEDEHVIEKTNEIVNENISKDKLNGPSWSFNYNCNNNNNNNKKTKIQNPVNDNRVTSICRKIINLYQDSKNNKIDNQIIIDSLLNANDNQTVLRNLVEHLKKNIISVLSFRTLMRVAILSGSIW
jgi:hypothetical protein